MIKTTNEHNKPVATILIMLADIAMTIILQYLPQQSIIEWNNIWFC